MAIADPLPPLEQIWWDVLLIGDYIIHPKLEKMDESDSPSEIKAFIQEFFEKSPEMRFSEFDNVAKVKFLSKIADLKKNVFSNPTVYQVSWQGAEKARKKDSEKIFRYIETAINWQELKKMPEIVGHFYNMLSAIPLSKDLPILLSHLRNQLESYRHKFLNVEILLNSLKALLPSKEILTLFLEWVTLSSASIVKCDEKLKEYDGEKNEFFEEPQLWIAIRQTIGEFFKLNKWSEDLEIVPLLSQICQDIKEFSLNQEKESSFQLKVLIPHLKSKFPSQESLIVEVLYVLYLMGILVFVVGQHRASKIRQRELQKEIEALFLPSYLKLVTFLLPTPAIPMEFTPESIKKHLPSALETYRKEIEIAPSNKPVEEVIKNHKIGIEKLVRKIGVLEAFITKSQVLVGSEVPIFGWLSKIHSYLEEDLGRKEGEFVEYVKNVENETQKSELQEKINEITKNLELSLQHYKETTDILLREKFSQLENVNLELKEFEKKYEASIEAIAQLIQQYGDEKHANVYSVLQNWQTYLADFQKKMKFSASNLFTTLMEKFKPLLEEEQQFFDLIQVSELSASSPAKWLVPKNLTVAENRQRIQALDLAIKDLDALREKMLEERINVEKYLSGTIQTEEKIESRQCVVCHKIINFAEDQFIKCPHCNRAAHYLCLAWWLGKHNNCVVCGAEFVIPDTDTYPVDDEESTEDDTSLFPKED